MKVTSILPVFAASASIASAKALLAVFPDQVTVGESYQVEWLSDSDESLELRLVHKEDYGWSTAEELFTDKIGHSPGGNYTWKLGHSTPTGKDYALWLSGKYLSNPSTGYADLTQWFEIVAPQEGKEDLKV